MRWRWAWLLPSIVEVGVASTDNEAEDDVGALTAAPSDGVECFRLTLSIHPLAAGPRPGMTDPHW